MSRKSNGGAVLPTPEQLRQMIDYNPEDGTATWRARDDVHPSWNTKYAGKPALNTLSGSGYRCGRVFRRPLKLHRVAWAIHYGFWPLGQIDHINGDRLDNRISNLRDVSALENARNQRLPKRNKSGHSGVRWSPAIKRWVAHIGVGGRPQYLGCFLHIQEAIAARKAAERLHGFHPNHGLGRTR